MLYVSKAENKCIKSGQLFFFDFRKILKSNVYRCGTNFWQTLNEFIQ